MNMSLDPDDLTRIIKVGDVVNTAKQLELTKKECVAANAVLVTYMIRRNMDPDYKPEHLLVELNKHIKTLDVDTEDVTKYNDIVSHDLDL